MGIGLRIKNRRKELGMTQAQLGEILGVSNSMVAQYETGSRKPKLETIKKVADALKCDPYYLLWGEKAYSRETVVSNVSKLFNLTDPHDIHLVDIATKRMEYEYSSLYGYTFTDAEMGMVKVFNSLNEQGQEKALERLSELLEIPRYAKE